MMSNLRFRDRLDSELENIEFTAQSRQKVLERAGSHIQYTVKSRNRTTQQELKHKQIYRVWLERINGFLEMELRIPVKPLVVALLITLSGLVYGCIGAAGVSAEEIQKSSITVVNANNGGQTNDLYKD